MEFLYCLIYLLFISVFIYVIGRIYPRKYIFENAFPFNSFAFEKQGKIYDKINIKKWKTKLPDASLVMCKIFPKHILKKRIDKKTCIPLLIKETCVAEATHFFACIFGFGCTYIWRKNGGFILSVAYAIANIPFILIQRYNRPRLKRALIKFI